MCMFESLVMNKLYFDQSEPITDIPEFTRATPNHISQISYIKETMRDLSTNQRTVQGHMVQITTKTHGYNKVMKRNDQKTVCSHIPALKNYIANI